MNFNNLDDFLAADHTTPSGKKSKNSPSNTQGRNHDGVKMEPFNYKTYVREQRAQKTPNWDDNYGKYMPKNEDCEPPKLHRDDGDDTMCGVVCKSVGAFMKYVYK